MITYSNEVLNYQHGQLDCEAGIYVDKEIVGVVQYTLFDEELTIKHIFIRPEYRRKGYGSRLMKYIQKENPDYTYKPSLKTELGGEFKHKDLPLEENYRAKYVNEAIKHLTPKSDKEKIESLKLEYDETLEELAKLDKEIQEIKQDNRYASQLALLLRRKKDIQTERKNLKFIIDLANKHVNEGIKHLTGRSYEEVNKLLDDVEREIFTSIERFLSTKNIDTKFYFEEPLSLFFERFRYKFYIQRSKEAPKNLNIFRIIIFHEEEVYPIEYIDFKDFEEFKTKMKLWLR